MSDRDLDAAGPLPNLEDVNRTPAGGLEADPYEGDEEGRGLNILFKNVGCFADIVAIIAVVGQKRRKGDREREWEDVFIL